MKMSGLAYICSAGETFDTVALKVYGDERYAAQLLEANPLLVSQLIFDGGEEVLLPVVEVSEEADGGYAAPVAPWREA